jgi:hypothetical protein
LNDSEKPQDQHKLIRTLGPFALVLPPWLLMGLMSFFTPSGYFTSLFTTPEGQLMLGVCGILSAISLVLTIKSKAVVVWILSFVFLVIPQMLVPFLGPSIITIIKAIGPVTGQ